MWESEVNKTGHVNRPEATTKSKRRWARLCGKSTWFKTNRGEKEPTNQKTSKVKKSKIRAESEGIGYVPFTKNSALKRQLQNQEDKHLKGLKSGRVRILERNGTSVGESISNPTPWKNQACGRTTCITCQTSKGGICKTLGAVYQISCSKCSSEGVKSHYIGESHRTIFDRMKEHFAKLDSRQKESSLVKHWKNFHSDEKSPPKYVVKVISSHKSATERQIAEAIAIENENYDNLLNSKSEWGQNSIPRQKTVVADYVQGQNKQEASPQTANLDVSSQKPSQRPKRSADDDSTFLGQFSQRKKRQRLENEKKRSI